MGPEGAQQYENREKRGGGGQHIGQVFRTALVHDLEAFWKSSLTTSSFSAPHFQCWKGALLISAMAHNLCMIEKQHQQQ